MLDSMSSKAEWPAWTESKEQLLAAFPNDTKKRFNSRCYHRVLDFEVRNGLEKHQSPGKVEGPASAQRSFCHVGPMVFDLKNSCLKFADLYRDPVLAV